MLLRTGHHRTTTHPGLARNWKSFLNLSQQPASVFRDRTEHVAIFPACDAIPVASDELLGQLRSTALKRQRLWLQPNEPEARECKPRLQHRASPNCIHPVQIKIKGNAKGSQE